MKQLLAEYKQSLRIVNSLHEDTKNENDKEKLGSMIRSLKFSMCWMETGRNPDNLKRGVEKGYDLHTFEKKHGSNVFDPYNMIDRITNTPRELNNDKKFQIDEALSKCTDREKQMFIMARVEYLSLQEIADTLGVSKSTAQTTIQRAEKKIKKQLESNIFLI